MSSSGRRQLRLGALGAVLVASLWAAAPAGARVLLVDASPPPRHHDHGSHKHRYTTIQDAVDAARPGDWILIAPGDYHERGDRSPAHAPTDEAGAGVMITTPRIHLRGLDRNRVVVDGTLPGSPRCSSAAADQDLGPAGPDGRPLGRNGVEVFKASGVTVENLTACNFLDGAGGGGNQIWFNGGDGSGTIGMGRYRGAWLSATSTFYGGQGAPAGSYGIFASNAGGPGLLADTYASNMDDSSYYIGACPDCNAVLTRGHAENSALGYSGTNSGGHLIIERSEWDQNKTGIVTNSQNNDDAPSPQDGRCPGTQRSCTFFRHNDIHDNNNPNVPSSGTASLGPPGTGIVVAGGRYDTVSDNRIAHNGAWGVLTVPFPDDSTPPLDTPSHCQGGTLNFVTACYYDDWANEVTGNRFDGNGFFGNPTNGDMGDISGQHDPGNCFHDNHGANGAAPTSAPGDLQATHGTCGVPNQGAGLSDPLTAQVICATEAFGPCPPKPGMSYPRATQVQMLPLPRQRSMPDPCDDVPGNRWCEDDDD
jgi:hypothetical protein